MRTVLGLLTAACLALAPAAVASSGSIVAPTIDATWLNGSASYTATNLTCVQPCSWRAVATAIPALYQCPVDPFEQGNITWQTDDYSVVGRVSATGVPFVGPGVPLRLCLFIDRRADGADHYLLAAEAAFTPNSLPGPSEYFEAVIADPKPVAKAKHRTRRHHRLYVKRSRTRISTAH